MMRVPPGVRAVFFDAVGTLIHPHPPAGDAYAEAGWRFGSRLDAAVVRRRFAAAFAEQERLDAQNGQRTSEAREVARWRAIVADVLGDVLDPEGCFAALYEHFARPDAWRVEPGAGEVLRTLRQAGYRLGVASNFDHRLRGVLAGLADLPPFDHLVISSEVGWKKPAQEFFRRLCEEAGCAPSQILLVGDDLGNDQLGATAAGLHALLLDPEQSSPLPPRDRLRSLAELVRPAPAGGLEEERPHRDC
jgi:putative hydrolase of the HAD superfamily